MNLSEEELAQIPIAPRATREVPYKKPVTFKISDDAAVMAIARMVVAGVDKQYQLFPYYREYVESYGVSKAEELIAQAVSIPGACDIIQVDPAYAGIGLFGGLAEDSKKFVFHEWSGGTLGQLDISLTPQEARDIVSGKKEYITFFPTRYSFYFCIDSDELRNMMYLKHVKHITTPVFTKEGSGFSLPEQDYATGQYQQSFTIFIAHEKFRFTVSGVHFPPNYPERRICITLKVPEDPKVAIALLLPRDPRWMIKSRTELF